MERKELQAREREGKGNSASKLFSNNADLWRPTFENLILVKDFFFSERYKSYLLEFWWSVSSVETFLVFVLQLCQWRRDKEKTDTQIKNKSLVIDSQLFLTCQDAVSQGG